MSSSNDPFSPTFTGMPKLTAGATPCPDENLLAEFVEGKTAVELKAHIEAHLDQCALCTELLTAMATTYRSLEAEAVAVEAPPAAKNKSQQTSDVSLPSRSTPLVLLLLCVHGVTVGWLLSLWLDHTARLDATLRVTPLGYLTLLQLCASLTALGVAAAAVTTPQRMQREPLYATFVLSWLHPALFVLVSLCARQVRPAIGSMRARRLRRWLAGSACLLYSSCLAVIASFWVAGTSLPLAPEFATGLLLSGLLSSVVVLVRCAGSASSSTAADRRGKAVDVLFGVCSVATGVGAALGLSLLLARLRSSN
jgi:hypothetical protein